MHLHSGMICRFVGAFYYAFTAVGLRASVSVFQSQNERSETTMTKINLRDFYPSYYSADCIIDVPSEMAESLVQNERDERAAERQRYRYKAHYSLDSGCGFEKHILFHACSADELYERKMTYEQLHAAISRLPDKQGKRIYAHFFLGMSQSAIARAEGVSRNVVSLSIRRGLKSMEQSLKGYKI